jgi:DNA-binding IclR family transcriptional regulator
LHQLASVSGETACLHVRLGWYGVRVASAPGTGEVANAPVLGETYPLADHFSGRTILVSLGTQALIRYRNWCAVHGRSGDSGGAFTDIRRQGYATGELDFAGQAPIAFPVNWAPDWVAAIAIEGPVFAPGGMKTAELTEWRAIAGHIETLARTQGAIFENPFPALDPESFVV